MSPEDPFEDLAPAPPTRAEVVRAVNALVDRYRASCLWFMAEGYPETDAARVAALDAIRRRADLEGFKRASELRAWLSANSSGASASS